MPERESMAQERESSWLEQEIIRRVLASRGSPAITVVLWDGTEIAPLDGQEPVGRMRIGGRRVLAEMALRPDPGLGDAYVNGGLEFDGDILTLLSAAFGAGMATPHWLRKAIEPLAWVFRHASLGQAKHNISRHYDLGNDFYSLWLDERMQYTCAFFPTPEASLEVAQRAKLERVCRKLALRPGEQVIEAGCGWGGLALHMAEHHGVKVRSFNISGEQVAFARERASQRGLADRVEFVEDDYRNIRGECDAFVSVGMLEHVGRESFATLSSVIDRCMAPHGRGLIHSIGRTRAQHMNKWLEENVFPGAFIPSLKEMMTVFEPHRLEVVDVENLRRHYARTLEHWLDRFEKNASRIASDYDERFVRMWRLYLASSAASFRTGSCQLYQVVFTREGNDQGAWSRDDWALDGCADPLGGAGEPHGAV
jgi:cyclopropane-fatty-acyl-phospholipid synthase